MCEGKKHGFVFGVEQPWQIADFMAFVYLPRYGVHVPVSGQITTIVLHLKTLFSNDGLRLQKPTDN